MDSQVAILCPVLDRPHRIAPLLESIEQATDVPHSVLFAASDQPTINELERLGARYDRDDGESYPKRINRLFRLSTEPYVFLGADDLAFRVGWLQAALRAMEDVHGVVAVNDLYNPAGVHFLVDRRYVDSEGGVVDSPGTVLCEEYLHQYCDDELRHTAQSRGRFVRAEDSVVEHLHHGAGKAPDDNTYAIGAAAGPHDHGVFMARRHLWGQ